MLLPTLLFAALALPAQDCHQADGGFGASGVASWSNSGTVHAMAVFDDGGGPALYVAGDFAIAGEVQAGSIARFDGVTWEDLPGPGGGSITSYGFGIRALEVYDDGSGPALYVAGSFDTSLGLPENGIVRWDGSTWEPVVAVTTQFGGFYGVTDMVVWDDGNGPALYFAGTFNKVDGQPAGSIAKYTGAGWAPLAGGYVGSFAENLVVHDDGSGEKLWVSGYNHPTLRHIQVWDGMAWTIDSYTFPSQCHALHVHDDGNGPVLVADASDLSDGRLVRWDGTAWSQVGGTFKFFPQTLSTFDDGTGPKLYAFGTSYSVPPPGWDVRAARWDGVSWEYLGSGLTRDAWASLVFDDGVSGPAIFVGGSFQRAGGKRADHLAKWTSTGWARAYQSQGLAGEAEALCTFDDGSGEALYADGGWSWDGGEGSVVRWSGTSWERIGGVTDGRVRDLAVFDDGGGPALYVSGTFERIGNTVVNGVARWDGVDWVPLGAGLSYMGFPGSARAMEVHDFGAGPRLVVGGRFDVAGGVSARNVAVWDGAAWTTLGSGFDGPVLALAVFDDGQGARLYAGGEFLKSGGKNVKRIGAWDGSAWQNIGGANKPVRALEVLDLGPGPRRYVGGDFYIIGGGLGLRLVSYDGTIWEPLHQNGEGLDAGVHAIASYDEGRGPELIAGGMFSTAGGEPARGLARWDGATWNAFPALPGGDVLALQTHDDGAGAGPALFAAGNFDTFGDEASLCVARYAFDCPCPPAPYCAGKPNSLGCTPSMTFTGTTSLADDSLHLLATDVLNNTFGLLVWSYVPDDLPFQGGTLCVEPPIVRTPVQSTGGNPPPADCSGSLDFHWSQAYVASKNLPLGEWYYTQYWSRDPMDAFGSSLSDAIRFLLCP